MFITSFALKLYLTLSIISSLSVLFPPCPSSACSSLSIGFSSASHLRDGLRRLRDNDNDRNRTVKFDDDDDDDDDGIRRRIGDRRTSTTSSPAPAPSATTNQRTLPPPPPPPLGLPLPPPPPGAPQIPPPRFPQQEPAPQPVPAPQPTSQPVPQPAPAPQPAPQPPAPQQPTTPQPAPVPAQRPPIIQPINQFPISNIPPPPLPQTPIPAQTGGLPVFPSSDSDSTPSPTSAPDGSTPTAAGGTTSGPQSTQQSGGGMGRGGDMKGTMAEGPGVAAGNINTSSSSPAASNTGGNGGMSAVAIVGIVGGCVFLVAGLVVGVHVHKKRLSGGSSMEGGKADKFFEGSAMLKRKGSDASSFGSYSAKEGDEYSSMSSLKQKLSQHLNILNRKLHPTPSTTTLSPSSSTTPSPTPEIIPSPQPALSISGPTSTSSSRGAPARTPTPSAPYTSIDLDFGAEAYKLTDEPPTSHRDSIATSTPSLTNNNPPPHRVSRFQNAPLLSARRSLRSSVGGWSSVAGDRSTVGDFGEGVKTLEGGVDVLRGFVEEVKGVEDLEVEKGQRGKEEVDGTLVGSISMTSGSAESSGSTYVDEFNTLAGEYRHGDFAESGETSAYAKPTVTELLPPQRPRKGSIFQNLPLFSAQQSKFPFFGKKQPEPDTSVDQELEIEGMRVTPMDLVGSFVEMGMIMSPSTEMRFTTLGGDAPKATIELPASIISTTALSSTTTTSLPFASSSSFAARATTTPLDRSLTVSTDTSSIPTLPRKETDLLPSTHVDDIENYHRLSLASSAFSGTTHTTRSGIFSVVQTPTSEAGSFAYDFGNVPTAATTTTTTTTTTGGTPTLVGAGSLQRRLGDADLMERRQTLLSRASFLSSSTHTTGSMGVRSAGTLSRARTLGRTMTVSSVAVSESVGSEGDEVVLMSSVEGFKGWE
ncbi:hypothetical protein HDV05_000114 [Chytridiales sp. JEL 0842]|nr:hypothetical protein HDV05_000114 [Chytridiales sp. JEL 0842]